MHCLDFTDPGGSINAWSIPFGSQTAHLNDAARRHHDRFSDIFAEVTVAVTGAARLDDIHQFRLGDSALSEVIIWQICGGRGIDPDDAPGTLRGGQAENTITAFAGKNFAPARPASVIVTPPRAGSTAGTNPRAKSSSESSAGVIGSRRVVQIRA